MRSLAAVLAAFILSSPAAGADYPTKPVRLIVPAPAGGNADAVARTVFEKVAGQLGQPFVIENRPGAGGNIGTEMAVGQPTDGYTLVEIITANTINQTLYPNLKFDLTREFTPVAIAAEMPLILVVHPSLPVKNVRELIDYAKKNPGKLNYASAGNGTGGHVAAELFKRMAGVDIQHVPYKGATPAVTDVIGGRCELFFDGMPSALAHVQAGRLRVIAITSSKRSATIPDVPTVAESGLPGFDVNLWLGFMAPVGTPPDIVAKLNGAVNAAVQSPAVRERFRIMGLEPAARTPEQFGALVKSEIARWSTIVQQSGAKVD